MDDVQRLLRPQLGRGETAVLTRSRFSVYERLNSLLPIPYSLPSVLKLCYKLDESEYVVNVTSVDHVRLYPRFKFVPQWFINKFKPVWADQIIVRSGCTYLFPI